MEVICLESQAFHLLFEQLVARIREEHKDAPDRWISPDETMRILRIKSKTTLSHLRSQGKIRYSQDGKRILYDILSINEYLNAKAQNPF